MDNLTKLKATFFDALFLVPGPSHSGCSVLEDGTVEFSSFYSVGGQKVLLKQQMSLDIDYTAEEIADYMIEELDKVHKQIEAMKNG